MIELRSNSSGRNRKWNLKKILYSPLCQYNISMSRIECIYRKKPIVCKLKWTVGFSIFFHTTYNFFFFLFHKKLFSTKKKIRFDCVSKIKKLHDFNPQKRKLYENLDLSHDQKTIQKLFVTKKKRKKHVEKFEIKWVKNFRKMNKMTKNWKIDLWHSKL